MKALHPADPLSEIHGIPDQSSVPSVFVAYQTITTIAAPSNDSTGTYYGNLAITPHPISFGAYDVHDNGTTANAAASILNAQLAGATHTLKWQSFLAEARRWRLAYMSVSIVQDGADLTNQGTIVASQSVVQPFIGNITDGTAEYAHTMAFSSTYDIPVYEASQSMPNSYFNRSKEGLYMPLRLTRTHQEWRSVADQVFLANNYPGTDTGYAAVGASNTTTYPFYGLATLQVSPKLGSTTSPMCNDIWGFISFKNIAVSTSLRVLVRAGYELQVAPGTILTPFQQISPAYDPVACTSYFQISRELKDAYPECYNSLGEIWDEISAGIKSVAPFLSFIPEVGPVLSGGATAIAKGGDFIRQAVSKMADKEKGVTLSAAQQKNASEAVDAVTKAIDSSVATRARKRIGRAGGRRRRAAPKTKKSSGASAQPFLQIGGMKVPLSNVGK